MLFPEFKIKILQHGALTILSPVIYQKLSIYIQAHTVLTGNPDAARKAFKALQLSGPYHAEAVRVQVRMRLCVNPVEHDDRVYTGHDRLALKIPAVVIARGQTGLPVLAAEPSVMERRYLLAQIAAPFFIKNFHIAARNTADTVQHRYHMGRVKIRTVIAKRRFCRSGPDDGDFFHRAL